MKYTGFILRNAFALFTITSAPVFLPSCSDENTIEQETLIIAEDQMNISLLPEDTSATVKFTATTSWSASIKDSESNDWISLAENKGVGGIIKLNIILTENNGTDRTATILIVCGNTTKEITVTQAGSNVQIMDESDVEDLEMYYKPKEFSDIDMFRSDSKWSWFRSAQSEHFFVFWEPQFGDDPNSETLDASMRIDIDDLLKKAEQFYKTNVEVLKFAELGQGKSYLDKYKMQIYLIYQTEWLATGSGYDDTIGALWVNPSTCKPVGSTIAHEIGHSFQYQVYCDKLYQGMENDFHTGFRYGYEGSNGGNGFWEQCAQWQSFQDYPEEAFTSYYFGEWTKHNHRHFCHEWMRYASYWLQYYWTEKHGIETVARIWQESEYPEDPIMTYTRLYCANNWEQMKTELYDYATRMATFDLPVFKQYADRYQGVYNTTLYSVDEGYYQVSYANCPGSTGFNVISLNVPDGGTEISAYFEGLAPGSSLADGDPGNYMESEAIKGSVSKYNNVNPDNVGWRYGFVALQNDGTRVYGDMNSETSKEAKFVVPANTSSLYFIVLGAPKEYNSIPWDEKELLDEQCPYKVKFSGTDLKGNVVLDPDSKPQDVTVSFDVAFPASPDSYDGTSIVLDTENGLEDIAKAFVLQPSAISGKMLAEKEEPAEGYVAFAAVKTDGSLDYNTTANGYGFWFDGSGNTIAWGQDNDSKLYVEYDNSSFSFTIGQYPGKCKAGDKYKVKEAFVYTKDSKQYVATIVFNITIE